MVEHGASTRNRSRLDTQPEAPHLIEADECVTLWAHVVASAAEDRDDYFFWEGPFSQICQMIGRNPDVDRSRLVAREVIQPLEIWEEAKRGQARARERRGLWTARPIREDGPSKFAAPCTIAEWEAWRRKWNGEGELEAWGKQPHPDAGVLVWMLWGKFKPVQQLRRFPHLLTPITNGRRGGPANLSLRPFPGHDILSWRAHRRINGH